jgi:two-component system, OmpR family, alkaline phosphatase synthesis response regulator PhoP
MEKGKKRVIVVEDEKDIAEAIKGCLERARYEVSIALTGEQGLEMVLNNPPDVLILDIMLPGMNGVNILRRLRLEEKTKYLPVAMLTARGQESDKIDTLDLGVDDYITKPFSLRELVARVNALVRRAEGEKPDVDDDGVLRIDHRYFLVEVNKERVCLTRKEFDLLSKLVKAKGRVLRRGDLFSKIWPDVIYGDDNRTLDVHVRRMRQKLGVASYRIETVVGVGYRYNSNGGGQS